MWPIEIRSPPVAEIADRSTSLRHINKINDHPDKLSHALSNINKNVAVAEYADRTT